MKAYVKHAIKQSEDPKTIPGNPLDWKYVWRREIYQMAEFVAKNDGSEISKLNPESYREILKELKMGKAPDIFNCSL